MKLAILQVADTGPLESLVLMLRSAGYDCFLPDDKLRHRLQQIGCDTVLSPKELERMGYARPLPNGKPLDEVGPGAMKSADLYVDVKAHRSYPLVVRQWPNLAGKVLWYRINGGKPEHVVNDRGDHGDEVNPPCPVLTPNMWYRDGLEGKEYRTRPWGDRAYACWPPFYRFDEYGPRDPDPCAPPVCLIHNLSGWGYGALVNNVRALGVRCYGAGSPDGLIQHGKVKELLKSACCMVHLKSNDAPGYALYEALASACPVICTRRLIWRCRMQELLIPGETCLVFDRETHDALTEDDVRQCTTELKHHLRSLADHKTNERIGLAGRARLRELMWDEGRDGPHFAEWLKRMFP